MGAGNFYLTLCLYPAVKAIRIKYGRMFYWPIVNKDNIEITGPIIVRNSKPCQKAKPNQTRVFFLATILFCDLETLFLLTIEFKKLKM